MNKRQIDRFLETLAGELGIPGRAFLTGAAAAAIWGRVRPSTDIDFALDLKQPRANWALAQRAVDRTTKLTGIPAGVAEDIDRWGMITLLDYKETSQRYRRFGLLEVRLLHPVNWSIGKLTRLLESDIKDVVQVFRHQAVKPRLAIRTWGNALRSSPASTAQFQFRRHVEDFLRRYGRRVWGSGFDIDQAIRTFHAAAQIRVGPSDD